MPFDAAKRGPEARKCSKKKNALSPLLSAGLIHVTVPEKKSRVYLVPELFE